MPLTLQEKKAIVEEVSEVAANAHSAVAAEYIGLTAIQMDNLRAEARQQGIYLRVVKNNLAKIALKDTDFECMSGEMVGPLLLAFSMEDPGSAARLVKNFAKENEKLAAKVVALNGQAMPGSQLERVASLPTKDEAISQLMSVMKAPIEKFVRTLNEPHAKLVRTIAAVRDQKQSAA